MIRWLGLLTIVTTLGCGAHPVLGRARIALQCQRVSAYQTGAGGWMATGCGRRATFVCNSGDLCVLESSTGAPELAREMDAVVITGFRCIAFASHQNRALAVCSAFEPAAAALARCDERSIPLTFSASGRPETLGDTPSTCVGVALLSVQPAPEFASMVVRLERR